MTLYTEILDDDDEDAGIHLNDFANAVSAWSWMQQRTTTVAEAAMTFNTTPFLIRQAIAHHSWMFLDCPKDEGDPTKQIIGHEGE